MGEKFEEGMSVFLWSVLAKLKPSPLHIRTLGHDPWTQPIRWGLLIRPRPGRFPRRSPCRPSHLCGKKWMSKHEHCPYYLHLSSFYPSCPVTSVIMKETRKGFKLELLRSSLHICSLLFAIHLFLESCQWAFPAPRLACSQVHSSGECGCTSELSHNPVMIKRYMER